MNISSSIPISISPPSISIRTCFCLLRHASRIGDVIGKSCYIIKHIQQESSSKISVLDAPPDSEYRTITVSGDSTINRKMLFHEEDDYYEEESSEYLQVSDAQLALVRVFERVLSVAAEADGYYFAPGRVVSCRLMVGERIFGFVIGKGGNVVERIKKDTGCRIRVLSQDRLLHAADEMIEVSYVL